jgi:hypothetical protein
MDMVDDVTNGIAWVLGNVSKFGGDPEQVHLMGQSCGGHLTALALLQQCESVSHKTCDSGLLERPLLVCDTLLPATGSRLGPANSWDFLSCSRHQTPCTQERWHPRCIKACLSHASWCLVIPSFVLRLCAPDDAHATFLYQYSACLRWLDESLEAFIDFVTEA